MDEPLLPTPRAQDEYERSNRKTVARAMDGDAQMTLTRFVRGHTDPNIKALRTSASSQGSEGSTSPSSKPSASPASDRSSTSQPALPFSSDGGPASPDGEMSTGSPLLRTPRANDWKGGVTGAGGSTRSPVDFFLPDQMNVLTSSSGATPASPSAPPADEAAPTIPVTSGPSSPVLLASYDPDGSCWRTYQDTFPWGDTTYSATLPRSGMTRRGRLYELRMSALPTAGSGGSALLHSPTASDKDGRPRYDHRASPGYVRAKPVPNLAAQVIDELLPTPTTDDASNVTRASGEYQSLVRSLGDLTNQPSEDGSE